MNAYIHTRKLEAITHYLTKHYFTTIRRAGHHVLYSLPDFDNLEITSSRLDYSVISTNRCQPIIFSISTLIRLMNTSVASGFSCCGSWRRHEGILSSDSHLAFLAEHTIFSLDEFDDLNIHLCLDLSEFGPFVIERLFSHQHYWYIRWVDRVSICISTISASY